MAAAGAEDDFDFLDALEAPQVVAAEIAAGAAGQAPHQGRAEAKAKAFAAPRARTAEQYRRLSQRMHLGKAKRLLQRITGDQCDTLTAFADSVNQSGAMGCRKRLVVAQATRRTRKLGILVLRSRKDKCNGSIGRPTCFSWGEMVRLGCRKKCPNKILAGAFDCSVRTVKRVQVEGRGPEAPTPTDLCGPGMCVLAFGDLQSLLRNHCRQDAPPSPPRGLGRLGQRWVGGGCVWFSLLSSQVAVAHCALTLQGVLLASILKTLRSRAPVWACVSQLWDETGERLSLDLLPGSAASTSQASSSVWQVLIARFRFVWMWFEADGSPTTMSIDVICPPLAVLSVGAKDLFSAMHQHPQMASINAFIKDAARDAEELPSSPHRHHVPDFTEGLPGAFGSLALDPRPAPTKPGSTQGPKSLRGSSEGSWQLGPRPAPTKPGSTYGPKGVNRGEHGALAC